MPINHNQHVIDFYASGLEMAADFKDNELSAVIQDLLLGEFNFAQ